MIAVTWIAGERRPTACRASRPVPEHRAGEDLLKGAAMQRSRLRAVMNSCSALTLCALWASAAAAAPAKAAGPAAPAPRPVQVASAAQDVPAPGATAQTQQATAADDNEIVVTGY